MNLILMVTAMNNLRKERQRSGYSLAQLSQALLDYDVKIGSDSLGKYERGDREPKLKMWKKLADFYGVSTEYLMGLSKASVGQRINQLRVSHSITQVELAKAIDVSAQLISKYEKDERYPKIDKLKKLADYFEVPLNSLTGQLNEPTFSISDARVVQQQFQKIERQLNEISKLRNEVNKLDDLIQEEVTVLKLLLQSK